MLVTLPQKQIEHRHGSILTFSHAIHRKIKLLQRNGTLTDAFINNWSQLKKALDILIEYLNDSQPLLASAAIKGISLIGSATCLPLPAKPISDVAAVESTSSSVPTTYDPDEKMEIDGEKPECYTKSYVAKTVLRLLRSAHSRPKIREEAAICLGYLAIGDGHYFAQGNLNAFIKLIKLVSILINFFIFTILYIFSILKIFLSCFI